jgi:hypothetical protein
MNYNLSFEDQKKVDLTKYVNLFIDHVAKKDYDYDLHFAYRNTWTTPNTEIS